MTESKMIKILSSYEDCTIFEVIDVDKYDFEKDKFSSPVKDIVLLSDIIEEFKNKDGEFYEQFKISSTFRDLIKTIESGKTFGYRYNHYEDSRQEFLDNWPKYHPDITYEEYNKKQMYKNKQQFNAMLRMINGRDTNDMIDRVYTVNSKINEQLAKSTKYHN